MKKSIAKKACIMLVCALMLITSSITAFAATPYSENGMAELIKMDLMNYTMVDGHEGENDGIVPYAQFGLSAYDLPRGTYVRTSSTYYVTAGVDRLSFTASWNPVGNTVLIGLVNVNDPQTIYGVKCTGGAASYVMSTSGFPNGEYYVVIANALSNTMNLNASGTFSWVR